jgi:hypothetical protein
LSGNKDLGVLRAAAQTEFLTYRRIGEDDPWTSGNFNMTTLLRSLSGRQNAQEFTEGSRLASVGNGVFDIALVKEEMMAAEDDRCAGMEGVLAFYFANLEDWFRTKFIHFPEREWWLDFDPDDEYRMRDCRRALSAKQVELGIMVTMMMTMTRMMRIGMTTMPVTMMIRSGSMAEGRLGSGGELRIVLPVGRRPYFIGTYLTKRKSSGEIAK